MTKAIIFAAVAVAAVYVFGAAYAACCLAIKRRIQSRYLKLEEK